MGLTLDLWVIYMNQKSTFLQICHFTGLKMIKVEPINNKSHQ